MFMKQMLVNMFRVDVTHINITCTIMESPPVCIIPCWQLISVDSRNLQHIQTHLPAKVTDHTTHCHPTKIQLTMSLAQMMHCILCCSVNMATLVDLLYPLVAKEDWTDLLLICVKSCIESDCHLSQCFLFVTRNNYCHISLVTGLATTLFTVEINSSIIYFWYTYDTIIKKCKTSHNFRNGMSYWFGHFYHAPFKLQ